MKRVTGVGGIFFKADNPTTMNEWYDKHLGLKDADGCTIFKWRHDDDPSKSGMTVWSLFPRDTRYFSPGTAPFMINYMVEDLDALLETLKAEGVWIDERRENSDFGRFAWIADPEGNRIELWQPPAEENESTPES